MLRRTMMTAAPAVWLSGCRASAWRREIARWETDVPALLEEFRVPGASLAVVRDGRLEWAKGFGVQDRSTKAPVETRTIFEAASMSKPVFAYVVMKLCEQGVLELDRPLAAHGDPRVAKITVRQVLSHTTGLPDIRSRAVPFAPQFEPGSKWQYSGEGFAYLQAEVTKRAGQAFATPCGSYETDLKVCGTDFDAFMRSRLLTPMGMSSSGYDWTPAFDGRMARPHDERGEPLPMRKANAADTARYGAMGGLLTTATDYAKFLIENLSPKPADACRLNAASRAEMLRPQIRVEQGAGYVIHWALGWRVAETTEFGTLISHGGDQAGFHSTAEMSPARKSAYVILTNGDLGWKLIQKLAPQMARVVHAA